MKKILTIVLSLTMLIIGCSACGDTKSESKPSTTPSASAVAPKKTEDSKQTPPPSDPYAKKIGFTIEMENGGLMKGELYPDLAPISVANFVKLANDKFYDGLIFHRVIPGFMIQGGGFDTKYAQKKAESIKGEFTQNGFTNALSHKRGVLSMARTQVPDSGSSQFFIMHADNTSLDGQYAAFGAIKEGLDVVDKIASCETTTLAEYGMEDVPAEPQVIKTITIIK